MNGVATLGDVESIEATDGVDLPKSTYDLLRRSAESDPEAPALSFFPTVERHQQPETWTYRQLFAEVTQTANLFHRLGATKDTVIAFVLPNMPETHAVIWGGQAAGIVLDLNPLLEGAALVALLDAAHAEILVTLSPSSRNDLWHKLEPKLATASSLRHVVLVDSKTPVGGSTTLPASTLPIHDFASSIAREPADELVSRRAFASSDHSSFFCTGGTTGLPKIAMRTHGNEVANAFAVGATLGDAIGKGKVLFCGLPLFHVNAGLVTGLLPFSRGAHVLLGTTDGYRSPGLIERFWEIVAHHRIAFFSGVPTLYASLLEVPVGTHDISSLEFAICGAAPLPTEVLRAFESRTGIKILEGYGLTEATCVSSVNPIRGERRTGSIGLRLPGQAMKTIAVDDGGRYVRDCRDGEVGVLVVSGPNVFSGYRDPAQNERLWIDCADGKRWLDTGDLARRDSDGYFWLTGRKKELIIRGGHNIDPAVIEEPLHRHPAVAIAAAVARPDPHAGELPVAYVQLRPGATATADELTAFLRSEISERAAMPKHVRVVEKIPLTAVGKIYKPALKHREAKDALEAALHEVGATARSLSIVDDSVRGMLAQVELADATSSTVAARALGQFPIPFAIVGVKH